MNDDYFKEQAARVRNIASFADPFTKKRLLALAERYDSKKSSPRQTPLPKVTPTASSVEDHSNEDDSRGNAR
jgi:hypothetical protein